MEDGGKSVFIDVLSDVQGAVDHYRSMAMPALAAADENASALVLNGDLVNNGSEAAWQEFEQLLIDAPHPSGKLIESIGNHEYYGREGGEVYRSRFLKHVGRSRVWCEEVVEGFPVLVLGSEGYEYGERGGQPPFVTFSAEQLDWFAKRVAFWNRQGKPMLIFSHHVLPGSVSGTDQPFYTQDYGAAFEAFVQILSTADHAALFTSHTHWGLGNPDWAVDYALPSGKSLPVFNTGAVQNQYVLAADGEEDVVSGEHASGLRLRISDSALEVQALDFALPVPQVAQRTVTF